MENRCPPESVNSLVTPWPRSARATRRPPCSCVSVSVPVLTRGTLPGFGVGRPGGGEAHRVDDGAAQEDEGEHVEPAEHDQYEHDRGPEAGDGGDVAEVGGEGVVDHG